MDGEVPARPRRRKRQSLAARRNGSGVPLPARRRPGFTWDRGNGYQADSVIPDSRIDYILVGLPRHGQGKVRSARVAGARPIKDVWPSDHFAVVADVQE
jgi:endonuclease/exonuclease/phosphatase family metal-dependent hydrolase